jgi:hypothetical protein
MGTALLRVCLSSVDISYSDPTMLSHPSSTSHPFLRPVLQTCGSGLCPLGYGYYRFASFSAWLLLHFGASQKTVILPSEPAPVQHHHMNPTSFTCVAEHLWNH